MTAQLTFTFENTEYKIPKSLASNLDVRLQYLVLNNMDLVLLFDGAEGSGKSQAMRLAARYCQWRLAKGFYDPRTGKTMKLKVPFSIDNIHFELDKYLEATKKADRELKKGWINIIDESRALANRKRATSRSNVKFTNFLSECRSANQIHMVALPWFHDMDSYLVLARAAFIVNIRLKVRKNEEYDTGLEMVKGEYRLFERNQALTNMYYHKLRYMYPRRCVATGIFENCDGFTPTEVAAYEQKKIDYRSARDKEEEQEADERLEKIKNLKKQHLGQQKHLAYMMVTQWGKQTKDIAPALGVSVRSVQSWIKELRNADLGTS